MPSYPPYQRTAGRLCGVRLELATIVGVVVGAGVFAFAAWQTGMAVREGFGLDRLIEIGASIVVIRGVSQGGAARRRRSLRQIGARRIVPRRDLHGSATARGEPGSNRRPGGSESIACAATVEAFPRLVELRGSGAPSPSRLS